MYSFSYVSTWVILLRLRSMLFESPWSLRYLTGLVVMAVFLVPSKFFQRGVWATDWRIMDLFSLRRALQKRVRHSLSTLKVLGLSPMMFIDLHFWLKLVSGGSSLSAGRWGSAWSSRWGSRTWWGWSPPRSWRSGGRRQKSSTSCSCSARSYQTVRMCHWGCWISSAVPRTQRRWSWQWWASCLSSSSAPSAWIFCERRGEHCSAGSDIDTLYNIWVMRHSLNVSICSNWLYKKPPSLWKYSLKTEKRISIKTKFMWIKNDLQLSHKS